MGATPATGQGGASNNGRIGRQRTRVTKPMKRSQNRGYRRLCKKLRLEDKLEALVSNVEVLSLSCEEIEDADVKMVNADPRDTSGINTSTASSRETEGLCLRVKNLRI